ncbi:MAG: N-acetyl-alpha-D-glucosaminyl L-malate synthase BshA [Bacteroidetes bacterium SB0662_bin_6]|nr:N-acetyl-alpha-D-glucosaminyl L-malate synthase BshA [Bacteroidetes bacterium SB0668_bin_1]MYE05181.1 N-acetyl-alpha-D-glucosaminyl L-malate synthase BshA [Bacteroidetes bacterium SB0662_bin_6]
MNIGITCYPVYGGSGVVATELGKALALRGHQIHFIAYSMPFRLAHVTENISFHEVAVNTYPLFEYPPYSLALTGKMVDVARFEHLDILHVHYAIPHATSAVLAREILREQGLYVPVFTTLHGTDITLVGQDPGFAPVVNHAINHSDGVTAVSEYLRSETKRHFQVDAPIEVIPNFIDTTRFRRCENKAFKQAVCPDGGKVIVHVSNFRPVKRVEDVIRVFHRLVQEGMAVNLLLAGDGPDRMSAERLARELGVWGQIRFLGKQEPIEELLSIADVFLIPSGSETFGLAALEAMACNVPIVSSNIGGLPELNVDGETGFLCPLGDIDALTEKTRAILSDDALQQRLAEGARRRAVEMFDQDRIVPMYEAYYEQALQAA